MKNTLTLVVPAVFLLVQGIGTSRADAPLDFRLLPDSLVVTYEDRPLTRYVFRDARIYRPYFANLRTLEGIQVTRNHPPLEGVDATDHDTMHPGLWLAFGDINGADFWRNQGRIEHVRFTDSPEAVGARLTFATECRLVGAEGPLGTLTNRFVLCVESRGWWLVWETTFQGQTTDLSFGDQEEMGFGVRMATALTEKAGGQIRNSEGLASAKKTWGQDADWCDTSGQIGGRRAGVVLLADPGNFRRSWWHNRDYGLMVANPFGREAMRQGEKSSILVKAGETLRLRFGAVIYSLAADENLEAEALFRDFEASGR